MRQIEINLSEDQIRQAGMQEVIYRFSTWGFEGYDIVTIWPDGKEDFIASFESTLDPHKKFVMGAIRRGPEEFSFHS